MAETKALLQALEKLADALDRQNNLLKQIAETVYCPTDGEQPPRLLVGMAGVLETISL